jgi:hypothetical protein
MKRWKLACALLCVGGMGGNAASADGISAYLPINIEPEIERKVERVLILADEPIMKRPISVAMVEYALTKAAAADPELCAAVRAYLERYSHDYGVAYASATAAHVHRGVGDILPDSHGMPVRSDWNLLGAAYVQPNDHFAATLGVDAYSGRTAPTGSMLSVGFNWAQLDVGYRDHWFSPLTASSMLMSTEAPTMPSITVSNYEPLGAIGFEYELFLARMSRNLIAYDGRLATGDPRLFGVQLSVEPFPGWSLGVNRLLQYGGGDGLPGSAKTLLKNFFKPSGSAQLQGNQQASYISRFVFPGKVPFSVYFQYAGENNEDGGSYLLGNSALSAGIDFPHLGPYLDLTYEYSEWQNTWYTHFIYLDGMTYDGIVTGNWGANQRLFNQGVGAREHMLRAGWVPAFGGYLEEQIRVVANQPYAANGEQRTYIAGTPGYPYHHYRDFTLRYSLPWKGTVVGGEVLAGKDEFGMSFSRLSAFVRYGGDEHLRAAYAADADDGSAAASDPAGGERFVDLGAGVSKTRADLQIGIPAIHSNPGLGEHLGLGARRAVSEHADLGVRAEFDEVHGVALIGVRPIDWRYRFDGPFALSAFAGAARYNLATPAFSLYAGAGVQWRDLLPHWDLALDVRYAQNLARDHLLASDPQGARPDSFYKIETAVLYLSRKF